MRANDTVQHFCTMPWILFLLSLCCVTKGHCKGRITYRREQLSPPHSDRKYEAPKKKSKRKTNFVNDRKKHCQNTKEFPAPNRREKADFLLNLTLCCKWQGKESSSRTPWIVRALEFHTHCRINYPEECKALGTVPSCFL